MNLRKLLSAAADAKRRGNVLVLSALMMVMVLAFTAFSVDVGYIVLTKAQLQRGADSAAFAAASELSAALGPMPERSQSEAEALARQAAAALAAANTTADKPMIFVDANSDVRFGQYQWSDAAGAWVKVWGAQPYTMVEVTCRRDGDVGAQDGELELFVAQVIGDESAALSVRAVCGLLPGDGFQVYGNKSAGVLPITYDQFSWEIFEELYNNQGITLRSLQRGIEGTPVQNPFAFAAFTRPETQSPFRLARLESVNAVLPQLALADLDLDLLDLDDFGWGFGEDNYAWDPDTGTVVAGHDGIPEINLYPGAGTELPPGNRGLLLFGQSGADNLAQQISVGMSEADLAAFGGELTFANGPVVIGGNQGIKASLQDELQLLIGNTRALPIFSEVEGSGNNIQYTLVKFVGVRILYVDLDGYNKHVTVQPAIHVDAAVKPSTTISIENATLFTSAKLIE